MEVIRNYREREEGRDHTNSEGKLKGKGGWGHCEI